MAKKSVKKPRPAGKKPAPKRPVAKKSAPARASAKVPVKPAPVPEAPTKAAPKGQGYGERDLAYFKKIIQEKRQEILEELESLKASMMDSMTGEYVVENSAYSLHMEQGTDTMEREKTFLFASREGKFLNYLDDALKRIENGTYGFCTDCGKLIEKGRLEAVPHAQLCVQCKLRKSRREPREAEL
jgi:RNA polymerase-binding protein DksA